MQYLIIFGRYRDHLGIYIDDIPYFDIDRVYIYLNFILFSISFRSIYHARYFHTYENRPSINGVE